MSTKKASIINNPDSVTKVYSGKPNKCCCGCSGVYYDRDGKTNSKDSFKLMLNKVLAFMKASPKKIRSGGNYASIEVKGRLYILYND